MPGPHVCYVISLLLAVKMANHEEPKQQEQQQAQEQQQVKVKQKQCTTAGCRNLLSKVATFRGYHVCKLCWKPPYYKQPKFVVMLNNFMRPTSKDINESWGNPYYDKRDSIGLQLFGVSRVAKMVAHYAAQLKHKMEKQCPLIILDIGAGSSKKHNA